MQKLPRSLTPGRAVPSAGPIGLRGAKPPPQNQNSPPENFTDNNVFRSVQIGMLVLCSWYFRMRPWNALRCEKRAPIFQNFLRRTPRPPAKTRAFTASWWPTQPATISAPPKSSIVPQKFWTWLRARKQVSTIFSNSIGTPCMC